MFLNCTLGPALLFGSRKNCKFSNQVFFCHNNKPFWSSQAGGGGDRGEGGEGGIGGCVVKEDMKEFEKGYVKEAEGE